MKPFIPTKIAEIVFAIVLAYFGYLQVKYISVLDSKVPHFMPGDGKIWIYVFATLFLLTAISILTDIKKTIACYVFAAVLIFVAVLVNGQHFSSNPADTLRDLAFAMAAIVIGNGGKKG